MKRLRVLSAMAAGVLLGGCNLGLALRAESGESPYFRPGPDARVVMLQEARVPPNQLRAFFQYGQQVAQREVNPHYPNCNLELNTLAETARSIPPGSYAVTRTLRHHAHLAATGGTLQVAALGLGVGLGGGMFDDGSPTINFETRFYLQPLADGAADIRALNCSQWGDPTIGNYPTRQEIAQALGTLGRLEP
jgi:hypothetical protein